MTNPDARKRERDDDDDDDALDVAVPEIERRAKQELLDQLISVASEWEPMLHVEEIPVGDNYGSTVNLSLWIWIEDEGTRLIYAEQEVPDAKQ